MTPQASPSERSILLVYYVLGISDTDMIRVTLNYRDKSSVYEVLARFRGRIDRSAFQWR